MRWGAHPSSMRRDWQHLLSHRGPCLPSPVVRGLWGTLKDAGGVTPGDAGGGIVGDTARETPGDTTKGWDRARGTLVDPASNPSPPTQAHVPSQYCLTKGRSQPCVSTSRAVFHAGTRPSNRSTLGFQPLPPLAPHYGLSPDRERAQ